jgi:prepilin-type processing-associated H-X9-DG protein
MKNFKRSGEVLAYEPVANHGRKTTYFNVLFADGHAASVPGSVLAQMVKELNAGQIAPPVLAGK